MSGPSFGALILEDCSELTPDIVAAVGAVLRGDEGRYVGSEERCLVAVPHGQHLWLSLQWLGTDDEVAGVFHGIARPLAQALAVVHRGALWEYYYTSTSAYVLTTTRHLPDGSTPLALNNHEVELPADPDLDFEESEWVEAQIHGQLAEQLGWERRVFPDSQDDQDFLPPFFKQLPATSVPV